MNDLLLLPVIPLSSDALGADLFHILLPHQLFLLLDVETLRNIYFAVSLQIKRSLSAFCGNNTWLSPQHLRKCIGRIYKCNIGVLAFENKKLLLRDGSARQGGKPISPTFAVCFVCPRLA